MLLFSRARRKLSEPGALPLSERKLSFSGGKLPARGPVILSSCYVIASLKRSFSSSPDFHDEFEFDGAARSARAVSYFPRDRRSRSLART